MVIRAMLNQALFVTLMLVFTYLFFETCLGEPTSIEIAAETIEVTPSEPMPPLPLEPALPASTEAVEENAAQKEHLESNRLTTTAAHFRVKLDVKGSLVAPTGKDSQAVTLPIDIAARYDYLQTHTTCHAKESPKDSQDPPIIREYRTAVADVRIDGHAEQISLASDARMLVLSLKEVRVTPYLPNAYLTRSERELLSVHFDSAILDQILIKSSTKHSQPNNTWDIPHEVVAGLLLIDTVDSGVLEARVTPSDTGGSSLVLSGVITGAIDGSSTTLTVQAAFQYADKQPSAETLQSLSATIRESRTASHVAPGLELEARIDLIREHTLDESEELGRWLASIEPVRTAVLSFTDTSDSQTQLTSGSVFIRRTGKGSPGLTWHLDPEKHFDIVYESRWHEIEDLPRGFILRLIDRGALVSQCSVAMLPPVPIDAVPTVKDVQRDIERSLGAQFGIFEESEESKRPDGTTVIRVASTGTAEELPFRWIHYVLISDQGKRISVSFMTESSMQKRFETADRSLVNGIEFLEISP